jgi:hypothetical protein
MTLGFAGDGVEAEGSGVGREVLVGAGADVGGWRPGYALRAQQTLAWRLRPHMVPRPSDHPRRLRSPPGPSYPPPVHPLEVGQQAVLRPGAQVGALPHDGQVLRRQRGQRERPGGQVDASRPTSVRRAEGCPLEPASGPYVTGGPSYPRPPRGPTGRPMAQAAFHSSRYTSI